MSYPNRGGRVAPDNRGPSVSGVGKNSKRTDMERRSVPFLHDSDLQQGDIQAMEQGQRIAPKQTQRPAAPAPAQGSGTQTERTGTGAVDVPDAIDFLSGIAGGGAGVNPPRGGGAPPSANMDMWVRFASQLVNSPGSSGMLAGAYINQLRQLRRTPQIAESVLINLADVDDALEAALNTEQENARPRSA